jgi:hypothetical protein
MEELDAFFKRTGYKKHHVTISSNGWQTISLTMELMDTARIQ